MLYYLCQNPKQVRLRTKNKNHPGLVNKKVARQDTRQSYHIEICPKDLAAGDASE